MCGQQHDYKCPHMHIDEDNYNPCHVEMEVINKENILYGNFMVCEKDEKLMDIAWTGFGANMNQFGFMANPYFDFQVVKS